MILRFLRSILSLNQHCHVTIKLAAVIAHWVRKFTPKAEGRVFGSLPQHIFSHYKRLGQLQCQMLGNSCECQGSSEMVLKNGSSVSQMVWHAKKPLQLNDHTYRVQVNICNPSPVIVSKIFECCEKFQT